MNNDVNNSCGCALNVMEKSRKSPTEYSPPSLIVNPWEYMKVNIYRGVNN